MGGSEVISYRVVQGSTRIEGREVQGILPVDVTDTGDTRLYKLALPFLPPSKNVYDQWPGTFKSSAKKKWERHIVDWAHGLAIPRASQVGLAAVLVFPSKARRDIQNYAQTLWHFVPDALQKAGVLDDDSDGHVQFGPQLGIKFAYDLRKGIPKERRSRTIVAVTMRVR